MRGGSAVNLLATTTVLSEAAANLISLANQLERDAPSPGDPVFIDMHCWAAESRTYAGACIAAINHLNGVSPE